MNRTHAGTNPTYMAASRVFLTAEWRNLVLLNYEVEPGLLRPFLPRGTELDRWNNKTFVSLVGFRFLKTRVFGIPISFHSNFDEVNLRFYVRREVDGKLRRGVVFIKEIVPRRAIAFVARTFYNENYVALPMSHDVRLTGHAVEAVYRWRSGHAWSEITFKSQGEPDVLRDGSQEQFIAEHYWGYAAQSDGGCVEYQVAHPSWRVWQAQEASFRGDVEKLYGPKFAAVLRERPASAFLAEGSEVTVMRGRRL